ncbi:DeoR/GlpR family DNA-binding transcription regulator [Enterococcus sp. BWT-B8]|uniref:DeoR/GlpR family DNA-binding transcription regulator n=1 Tax=Enterococcus sp. BWT-B8 TaxID=2885157 RepID=UPI001E65608E|nr:DeoR/GlpR family DNA-binding transcription regulator [Enterococcus sp. BWT-B8]MCB5952444.1 DeoR/GlpR family DNA-binding transcription regulator [Enterococcus sp. BWT-B8]
MKASEITARRNRISELLYQNQTMKVTDLVAIFNVSDETIRKDLSYLEDEGILIKKYGRAELVQQEELTPVINRTPIHLDKKRQIAEKAAEQIPKHSCSIGLDQGSTVALLAAKIQKLSEKQIFTGSLAAILELVNSQHQIYCFGGRYAFNDMAFHNDTSIELYPDIQLDLCFFGSSGVQNREGFCTSSLVDAEIKRKLLKKSAKKIVLLDNTKFESTSLVQVASWKEIDLVITNHFISQKDRERISAQTELITV